jgi:hypothetical protein
MDVASPTAVTNAKHLTPDMDCRRLCQRSRPQGDRYGGLRRNEGSEPKYVPVCTDIRMLSSQRLSVCDRSRDVWGSLRRSGVSIQTEDSWLLRDRQGSRCKSLKRVKCRHLVLSEEEWNTILPSLPRQAVDSALKPAFDGDNAPRTVVNGDFVHTQRCRNSPTASTKLLMAVANRVILKTDPCGTPFS